MTTADVFGCPVGKGKGDMSSKGMGMSSKGKM
jgi:hypothetical protein